MTTLFPDVVHVAGGGDETTYPEPGLERHVGAYKPQLFLAEHRMEKEWAGEAHSHPHDQMAYVVSGHLRIQAGDQTFEIRGGDSFVVRGGVQHQAWALESSVVVA